MYMKPRNCAVYSRMWICDGKIVCFKTATNINTQGVSMSSF